MGLSLSISNIVLLFSLCTILFLGITTSFNSKYLSMNSDITATTTATTTAFISSTNSNKLMDSYNTPTSKLINKNYFHKANKNKNQEENTSILEEQESTSSS